MRREREKEEEEEVGDPLWMLFGAIICKISYPINLIFSSSNMKNNLASISLFEMHGRQIIY